MSTATKSINVVNKIKNLLANKPLVSGIRSAANTALRMGGEIFIVQTGDGLVAVPSVKIPLRGNYVSQWERDSEVIEFASDYKGYTPVSPLFHQLFDQAVEELCAR